MARDPKLAESGVLTGNTTVHAGPCTLFSITIGFGGATAGQKVVLRDGTTEGSEAEVVFVLGAATGTITKDWKHGKKFDAALRLDRDEVPGAQVFVEMTYKT